MTDETEQQDATEEPEEGTEETPAAPEAPKAAPPIKKWHPGPAANRPGGGFISTGGSR